MAELKNLMTKGKKIKKKTKLTVVRTVVQIIFFLVAPALFSQAFSGLKGIFSAFGSGTPMEWNAFILKLVALLAVTIVFGRIFCGWACAFGALGDWVYMIVHAIAKKAGVKIPQIPEKVQHYLQILKYVILALILVICVLGQAEAITKNSPWTVFSLLSIGNFKVGHFPVAVVLLVLIVIGMAVKERFFCQFLCPMGAVFSLMPELPFLALKRHKETCPEKCNLCRKGCPVDLKLTETPIREGECIRCMKCMVGCPRKNIRILK